MDEVSGSAAWSLLAVSITNFPPLQNLFSLGKMPGIGDLLLQEWPSPYIAILCPVQYEDAAIVCPETTGGPH